MRQFHQVCQWLIYASDVVSKVVAACRTRRIKFGSSDGGDGGAGGSVVVVAEPSVRSLSGLRPHYRGRNGDRGSGGYRLGTSGRTAIIKVSQLHAQTSVFGKKLWMRCI